MIGNTHFDPVWLWRWDEACASIRATFRSALDRMKEDEGFIYSFSSPPVFEWIKKTEPEMFLEICERVAEGRWELCEGWWVQTDCYGASGESYVRQGLYGQKYLKENFGKISDTVFNIDSFGHNPALVQILKKSHIENYCFVRPEKHHTELPSQLFRWQGIDKSEILTYRVENPYAKTIVESANSQSDKDSDNMIVYGVTDHGGAPTKKLISEINATENAFFSTVSDFFKSHRSECKNTYCSELLTGDFGPYSNYPYIKKINRIAEYAVLNAEKTSVILNKNENETLEKCWHDILFNQFHDILGGACIKDAYFDAENSYGRAITTAEEIKHLNLQAITKNIKTPGKNGSDIWNLIIWNLNSKEYNGYIEAEVQWAHEFDWYSKGIALRDGEGNIIPCQVIREKSVIPGFRSRFVFKASLPALGYNSFVVIKTEEELVSKVTEPLYIKSNLLEVEISKDNGCIKKILKNGKILANHLFVPCCYYDDGDTWCFNTNGYDKNPLHFDFVGAKVIESGDLRTVIKCEYTFKTSILWIYYTIYSDENYIDVRYRVNWNEKHYVLKLECDISESRHISGIPYGFIERSENTKDMPMSAVLKMSDYSVISDGIFSYNITDSKLGLTVLRSPIHGDLRLGEIDYTEDFDHISQGISEGKIRIDFMKEMDYDNFLNPPCVITESNHDGNLPMRHSYISVDSKTVTIGTIKKCEYDKSVIIRLFEETGKPQNVVLKVMNNSFDVSLTGYEIKTLKLTDGKISETFMTEE